MITKILEESYKEREEKVKRSFYPTDCTKNVFDLYHAFKGTPQTNPPDAEKLNMFRVAKLVEESLVKSFEDAGVLHTNQLRIEMWRHGVYITGYADAVLVLDNQRIPVEVKTFFGDYQAKELGEGKVKKNYAMQLAVYMDFLQEKRGILLYCDRGSGKLYEFNLVTEDFKTFTCGELTFNIEDEYKRWWNLYKDHIVPNIEPKSEYLYKFPVAEVDWMTVPKSTVTDVRMGRKVYGNWEVLYSPYKDLIVAQEGTQLGYSEDEMKVIMEKTTGYTSKK